MLFQIMGQNKAENLNKISFWQGVEKNNVIPERTAEHMKRFYNTNENNTVELWLVDAVHNKSDFSFSLKDIPSVDFESGFRRKYEIEFMRHETLAPMGIERPSYDQQLGVPAQSSVYSQNLARTISMASI